MIDSAGIEGTAAADDAVDDVAFLFLLSTNDHRHSGAGCEISGLLFFFLSTNYTNILSTNDTNSH